MRVIRSAISSVSDTSSGVSTSASTDIWCQGFGNWLDWTPDRLRISWVLNGWASIKMQTRHDQTLLCVIPSWYPSMEIAAQKSHDPDCTLLPRTRYGRVTRLVTNPIWLESPLTLMGNSPLSDQERETTYQQLWFPQFICYPSQESVVYNYCISYNCVSGVITTYIIARKIILVVPDSIGILSLSFAFLLSQNINDSWQCRPSFHAFSQ